MKILHFDFDDLESPFGGGQAVRTFEINRRLAAKGHDIKIITLDYKNAKNKMKEGIKYERTGLKKAFPLNLFSYFSNIATLIKKNKFDLIVEDNIPPFSFGLSPLYTEKPVISQIQCLFAKTISKKFYVPFWVVEKYGAKVYKNFIVLTKTMGDEILKLNKKAQVKIIPNGLTSIPPFSSSHKNYLLFLGRIEFYQKGIDFLLESAEILQKKAPNIKIIMAGDGIDSKKLQRILKRKTLSNVEWIGKITGEEKTKIIKESMMLLQPSRLEIFPFTMLEAAAYGKPIVCFNIKNIDELMAKKIGIAAHPFRVEEYTHAILNIINNEQERLRYAKNAYKWAQNHQWDQIVDVQEKFYFECLERGKTVKY